MIESKGKQMHLVQTDGFETVKSKYIDMMTDFLYYEKIPAEIWNRKDDKNEGSSD